MDEAFLTQSSLSVHNQAHLPLFSRIIRDKGRLIVCWNNRHGVSLKDIIGVGRFSTRRFPPGMYKVWHLSFILGHCGRRYYQGGTRDELSTLLARSPNAGL